MKRFITKFFHEENEKDNRTPAINPSHLTTIKSFKEVKKRAMIGWLVYRLTEGIDLPTEKRDGLFLSAFSYSSIENIVDEKIRELFQLAAQCVDWLEKNSVVEEEMKKLIVTKENRDTLSRLLSEIQTEMTADQHPTSELKGVWEVYRDVIYAATDGSFLLIEKDQIEQYTQGKLLCEVVIKERQDIPKARNLAKEAFNKEGLKPSKSMSYNLIISEAVTNILKHAEHGKMVIYKDEDIIRVVVVDKGPGFPLKILPRTTLMAGFSTKESLGQGFTLMMKMAEQIVLETSSDGSTLILILDGKGEDGNEKSSKPTQ